MTARCAGQPTLLICVVDDSGSITAPGGADPISNRYGEVEQALTAIGKACRCGQELAAVVHFDTPSGDSGPFTVGRRGLRQLRAGLALPVGGTGTSDLAPALRRASILATQHPTHDVVLVVLSDFLLTDDDPAAVNEALAVFPGTVVACVLGGSPSGEIDATNRSVHVGFHDQPGAVARAVLEARDLHLLAPPATGKASRSQFHNTRGGAWARVAFAVRSSVARVRAGRRTGRHATRSGDVQQRRIAAH